MSLFKKIFQYTIYPIFMISAFLIIIAGIERGVNQYLITIPVIALYGFLALILERWMPYERKWLDGTDWNLDFLYYIINYLIKVTAQFSLIWLTSLIAFPQWFPTEIPFWMQVILALTLIDFFLFFVHWQSHKYMWLWKFHAIHHSSERLYFMNGEKRHAVHQILEGGPGILLCLFIGTPQPVVVAALAILAINMMMQHTNLDYKGGLLRKFFCVAELHRWHHRADYKDAQVNYGAWLTVWDHIFKTSYDKPQMRNSIGEIGIAEEKNFPRSYMTQFLYPFSKKVQKRSKAWSLIPFLFCLTSAYSQPPADDILGNWKMEDGSKIISVEKINGKYIGKITWALDKNSHSEVGRKVMWDLVYDTRKKEWSGGQIQMPDMSHPADVSVEFKAKDVIIITGYHGMRLFGKTKIFTRATSVY